MGEAINHALNQWEAVSRFIDHGEGEIDDNLVEKAIRPTAIGRKNWLFLGSEKAGVRHAAVFTLVQNYRMHGIEPCAYLKDVLERLPTMTNHQVSELTPLKRKEARQRQPATRQSVSRIGFAIFGNLITGDMLRASPAEQALPAIVDKL